MKIIRAYKNRERSRNNRRKFVVPETGEEAMDFCDLGAAWPGKTELWPCSIVHNQIRVNHRHVYVFRCRHDEGDRKIIDYVGDKLKTLGEMPARPAKSSEYRIELEPSYECNQWGVGVGIRTVLERLVRR